MPDANTMTVTGLIGEVFAHRFIIRTDDGASRLADLGPHGAEQFALSAGLRITAEGEMKPSELKVTRIETAGRPAVVIEHKAKHATDAATLDRVTQAVAAAGYTMVGVPHRKPKHFEVQARKQAENFELHVDLDGHVKKAKPATHGINHAASATPRLS